MSLNQNETQCNALMVNVNDHLNGINDKHFIIKRIGTNRDKRGYGVSLKAFGGSAAAYAIGTIIDYFRGDSKSEIQDLNDKTTYMQKLIDAHTSILNLTENVQENTINEANSVIDHSIKILRNESKNHDINYEAHWISTQLIITMNEFLKLQVSIIDGSNELKKGINHLWISFDQMHNQISLIKDQLPNDTRLYGKNSEEQLAAAYKLSTTRMLLLNETITFIFEIPLFRSTIFKCFELIPIPIEIGEKFLWIDNIHKYLWLTNDSSHYALTTEKQMQACSRFNDDQICDARIPSMEVVVPLNLRIVFNTGNGLAINGCSRYHPTLQYE